MYPELDGDAILVELLLELGPETDEGPPAESEPKSEVVEESDELESNDEDSFVGGVEFDDDDVELLVEFEGGVGGVRVEFEPFCGEVELFGGKGGAWPLLCEELELLEFLELELLGGGGDCPF